MVDSGHLLPFLEEAFAWAVEFLVLSLEENE